jgi:hypothetical protein
MQMRPVMFYGLVVCSCLAAIAVGVFAAGGVGNLITSSPEVSRCTAIAKRWAPNASKFVASQRDREPYEDVFVSMSVQQKPGDPVELKCSFLKGRLVSLADSNQIKAATVFRHS